MVTYWKISVKFIFLYLGLLLSSWCYATETITIFSPYSVSHSGTPAMLRVVETANQAQKEFVFVLEFRPGGNQIIAVKQMDQNPTKSLAIIAASFVENVEQKLLSADDYVPVWSMGDACWLVMSTVARSSSIFGLRDSQELVVGTVGFGNATHLTALQIAKKHNLKVRLIPFKSNSDAVVNMAGNNGVTFSIDNPALYENLRSVNPRLKPLAVSCPKRLNAYPDVPTLREQGIVAPSVINIVVANRNMPPERRQQLTRILEKSADQIGEAEILRVSGFSPAQFNQMTAQDHYTSSLQLIGNLRQQFQKQIKQAQ
jgi:tripartite-type tricarboxylate transporter receptor subunit TctC